MDIKSEIDKIKWHSNLLNSIIDKYEDNPEFFMDEEKKESVILMSTILNKINEDYNVSINMIKNNLLDQQNYSMDIDHSQNSESNSDTDSNMTSCSVGSDNFLYGLDNSDDESNEFNKLTLNGNTDDEIEELYGDYEDKGNEQDIENKIKYPEAITVQDNFKIEQPKKESINNSFRQNLLNETIDIEKILLYKKNSKSNRLSNYLENSYSY